MRRLICSVVFTAAAHLLYGQQPELTSLIAAAARLRATASSVNGIESIGKLSRSQFNEYSSILREWIESRLPANLTELERRFPLLQPQLTAELWRAGVMAEGQQSERVGDVSEIELSEPVEYPGVVVVKAGVRVPCGADESVFVYRFSTSRTRLLEVHGDAKWGNTLLDTKFSTPDPYGNRVFFVSWDGVQCASVWNALDFRLFRIGNNNDRAVPLFTGSHGFTIDENVNVKLTTGELLLEMTDSAMEGGFRRTHVLHYRIGADGVDRIDPVALQSQDFVHEWLLRPWSEMQSRSAPSLMKWHKFLHADYVSGEYEFVQPCKEREGVTQVAVGITYIGDQEMPQPLVVYFLVEDKGEYRFTLTAASFDRQSGCPGEAYASYDNPPSLFKNR